MTQRAILYCRQSRTEVIDDSLSLDAQERILRDYAARENWHVAVVRDADRHKTQRRGPTTPAAPKPWRTVSDGHHGKLQ